jgi:hypothetical protein
MEVARKRRRGTTSPTGITLTGPRGVMMMTGTETILSGAGAESIGGTHTTPTTTRTTTRRRLTGTTAPAMRRITRMCRVVRKRGFQSPLRSTHRRGHGACRLVAPWPHRLWLHRRGLRCDARPGTCLTRSDLTRPRAAVQDGLHPRHSTALCWTSRKDRRPDPLEIARIIARRRAWTPAGRLPTRIS